MTSVTAAGQAAGELALERPQGHLIDGEWATPLSGEWIDVEDPSTREVFGAIASGDAGDIDLAVAAARRSFKAGVWSRITPAERGRVLWRLADLVRENAEDLARLEARDSGKPIREAREDMAGTADIFEYYAGLASKIEARPFRCPATSWGWFSACQSASWARSRRGTSRSS